MLHNRQRLKQAFFQLQIKLLFHSATGAGAVTLRHAEADAVFRRRLRNQHHGNAGAGHRRENAGRHADHAFHARPRNVEHRHVIQVSDALNRQLVLIAFSPDQGARRLRVAGIFDKAWDLELGDGGNGAGMKNFGAEVGQLHGFLIRHRFQQPGVGNLSWVAGINAVDVGPDFTAVGAQAGRQHGSGIIGAVAA